MTAGHVCRPGCSLRFTATKHLVPCFITARRHLVAALQLLDLVLEAAVTRRALDSSYCSLQTFDLGHRLFVFKADFPPLGGRHLFQIGFGDLALGKATRTGDRIAAQKDPLSGAQRCHARRNRKLVIARVFAKTLDFPRARWRWRARPCPHRGGLNTRTSTIVPFVPGGRRSRWCHARRRRFSPKMARRSFSAGRSSGFRPFRRHPLPTMNVPGLNLGTDRHDSGFVEIAQEGFLADIGNIAGDLFRAQAWYRGP